MADTRIQVAPGIRSIRESTGARTLALSTLFACLTAIGAHLSVRLPFTPVPVTLQVFFVLLSGAVLGRRVGALSQAQYLALGAMGLPVFAGGACGLAAFAGPSAGYLPGFVAGAWVVGLLAERMTRPSTGKLLAACIAGVAALYVPGVIWLSLWLRVAGSAGLGSALTQAIVGGVLPFVGIDLVKAAAAAKLAARLTR